MSNQGLALALAAHSRFEWRAGMLAVGADDNHDRLYRLFESMDEDGERTPIMGLPYVNEAPAWGWPAKGSGWLPDLSDAPTTGALWDALIRTDPSSTWSLTEGWGRVTVSRDTGSGPGCVTSWSVLGGRGDAIATALLAVWGT